MSETSGLRKKKKGVLLSSHELLVGWREWCALPAFNIPAIKVKIDTGAKTSALQASNIEAFRKRGNSYIRFTVYPLQRSKQIVRVCTALVVDRRVVTSSNGHKERRYVILTPISIDGCTWEIEVTLSNREPLSFRMLLGREALKGRAIIDPQRSLCQGELKPQELKRLYGLG